MSNGTAFGARPRSFTPSTDQQQDDDDTTLSPPEDASGQQLDEPSGDGEGGIGRGDVESLALGETLLRLRTAAPADADGETFLGVFTPSGGPATSPTEADDFLTGTATADVIFAGGGADTVLGLEGNDRLFGELGSDELHGGAGRDLLDGDGGSDFLEGGPGPDRLVGGTDPASDIASYVRSAAAVSVSLVTDRGSGGDAEGDTLVTINDLLGSRFDDTLVGDEGDNLIMGGRGADQLVGGSGIQDVVAYTSSAAGVRVSLDTGLAEEGDAEGDLLAGFEGVFGSPQADTIIGSVLANLLVGDAGEDRIIGGDGPDLLIGGTEADTLTGGPGEDDFAFSTLEFVTVGGVAQPDVITDYEGTLVRDFIVIEGLNLPQEVDITQAGNGTGYVFDAATSQVMTDDFEQIVVTLENFEGGPVWLV